VQELRNVQAWISSGGTPTDANGVAAGLATFWYDSRISDNRFYFKDNVGPVIIPRLDRTEVVQEAWYFAKPAPSAPFGVASSVMVANLNANYLMGLPPTALATPSTVMARDTLGRSLIQDPHPSEPLGIVNLRTLQAAVTNPNIDGGQINSGVVALQFGGTGADLRDPTPPVGGLIYKSSSSRLNGSAALTAGHFLIAGGTGAPTSLAPPIPVSMGGTGATTYLGARYSLDVLWADDAYGLYESRAHRGAVYCDGLATGSSYLGGSSPVQAGLGDFSISVTVAAADYTPSPGFTIFHTHWTGNNRVRFEVNPAGVFQLVFFDAAGAAAVYNMTLDTPLVDGETYNITLTADRDGLAILYINGVTDRDRNAVLVSVSIAASAGVDIGAGNSNQWNSFIAPFRGNVYALRCFNYALSLADVRALVNRGVPFSDQWGSSTPTYTSNFTAGLDSFGATGGTGAGNIDSIAGQNDCMRYTTDVLLNFHLVARNGLFVARRKYRVRASVYIPAANVNIKQVRLQNNAVSFFIVTTLDTWVNVDVTTETDHDILQFVAQLNTGLQYHTGNGTDVFYVRNILVQPVGAVLDVDIENCNPLKTLTVMDRASNNPGLFHTSGVFQTFVTKRINVESVLASGLAVNQVLYATTGGLITNVPASGSSGVPYVLSQDQPTSAPVWLNLFSRTNSWTGIQTFQGAVNVPTPTVSTHAATMAYVDAKALTGFRTLGSCDLATPLSPGNIVLSGAAQTIDGVAATAGKRVLVKHQTAPAENGIYVVAAGAWTRATDCDEVAEIQSGAYTLITDGTTLKNSAWTQIATIVTIGTSPVTWQLFSQQAVYTGAGGVSVTGTVISLNLGYGATWTVPQRFTQIELRAANALVFFESDNVNWVAFRAPLTLPTDTLWTLPSIDGPAGSFLKTSGTAGGSTLIFETITSAHIAASNTHFVTQVQGTANRISVSIIPTPTAPQVDIAATYAGQASISILGTVTTGTWNASVIGPIYGGTGLGAYIKGDLIFASNTNVLARLPIGLAGSFVQRSDVDSVPAWSNYRFPQNVAINQLLVGENAASVKALPSVINSILTTDGSGAVAWRATLPAGISIGDPSIKVTRIKWFEVLVSGSIGYIDHFFGTDDVTVRVYETLGDKRSYDLVPVVRKTTDRVELQFATAPAVGQFRACVIA
jgi:hypothetical protein